MKITTLLGSANKKGNTATALGWVEAELASLGHEVERVTLNNKSIHGCLGCAKCRENPDDIDCVQNDDAQDIMERMILSDGVLFASPIYFWGFTAQTKLLIDRCFSLVTNYRQPGHTSLMNGKRVALLVTGGVSVHRIFPFESNPGKAGSRITKIGSNTFYEERERRFCI
jgi:multimeric flavodoxin WrbA